MQKTAFRLPHGVESFPKPFAYVHNMNTLSVSVKLVFSNRVTTADKFEQPSSKKEQGRHLWPENFNLDKMITASISGLFRQLGFFNFFETILAK